MNIRSTYDITNMHKAAKKRLPRVFLDYIDKQSMRMSKHLEKLE